MNDDRQTLEQMMLRPEVHTVMQQMSKKQNEALPAGSRLIRLLVLKEHIINSIFWNTLIDMLESEVKRRGFQFSLCIADSEDGSPLSGSADCYLLLGNLPLKYAGAILESHKPLVWVDSEKAYCSYNQVRANNHFGTYQMAKKAIELGHRRLAFLLSTPHLSYRERCEGMLECAEEYKHLGVACEVVRTDDAIRTQDMLVELLSRKDAPTFVQACCDSLAQDVYKVAEQLMIDIPGDLSVAGFDNIQEAWQLTPPLASVDVPRVDMAIAAVELLIKSMNNPLSVQELILLNPILVIRDSLSAVPRRQPLTLT